MYRYQQNGLPFVARWTMSEPTRAAVDYGLRSANNRQEIVHICADV